MPTIFERGRSFFQQQTARPTPTQPSLIDHVRASLEQAGAQVYTWVRRHSPYCADRIDNAVAVMADFERRGCMTAFRDGTFNASLLHPLQTQYGQVVDEVRGAATCTSARGHAAHFAIWNVVCLWLTVVLLPLELLVPYHLALFELLSCAYAYACTYVLAFIFLQSGQKLWMQWALIAVGLYVVLNVLKALSLAIFVLPLVLASTRVAAYGVLLWHGYGIFSQCPAARDGGAAAEML